MTALDINVRASLKLLLLLLLFIKEIVFGSWIGFIRLMTISIVTLLYSKEERVKKLGSF